MVILARREALPSLAIRAFHNPEVVSPLWRVPLTRTLVSQNDPDAVGRFRGVCARREGRRDGKRKISLENFLLCSSPRRDLAIPHGGVARGGYPRKLGHFFLKKFQMRLAVLVGVAREGRNGATANERFH